MIASGAKRLRKGAAAVEFALVMPLFFMLILGIIEFGRAIMVEQIITNAAREGARIAIVPGTSTAATQAQVANYLVNGAVISSSSSLNSGGNNPQFSVNPSPPSSATSGSLVTVTVSVPYNSVAWLPTAMFLGNATMTATCTMRTEN
jgi:Flp pilus assembly protein TadG